MNFLQRILTTPFESPRLGEVEDCFPATFLHSRSIWLDSRTINFSKATPASCSDLASHCCRTFEPESTRQDQHILPSRKPAYTQALPHQKSNFYSRIQSTTSQRSQKTRDWSYCLKGSAMLNKEGIEIA
ncbi:hypothetical protein O181_021017 [Austropuccinia psidii MF-1]|uniref:Uncharacterized protein n=1 Tax=Austropuccinia psidii MF-1 TaxID=1389203 RepID=A0A9Q3GVV4_9BASI|nr:hypothetical protein [Austropuccinia psidii MF-1]